MLRLSCWVAVVVCIACGGAPAVTEADAVVVSVVPRLVGVPDRGLDPSVVALVNARGELCSGVLIATDVVLTARRCVAEGGDAIDCTSLLMPMPAAVDPTSIHVYSSLDSLGGTWASAGVAVLATSGPVCGADLAVVVLSTPVPGAVATVVSAAGIATGAHVRTVGFGWEPGAQAIAELFREHAPVVDSSPSEFAVEEAACVGAPGSAAFDEATGEVVGVLSRWGTPCGAAGEYDVFTRSDAFYALVQQALAWGPALAAAAAVDGGSGLKDGGHKRDAGKAKKPPTDLGAACLTGADCGTGQCVTALGSQYCSRACAPDDHCPAHFKCVIASGGTSVCVMS